MKNKKGVFVLILFSLALLQNLPAQTKPFSFAKGEGKNQGSYEFDKWSFSIGENQYEINKNGAGKRINQTGTVTKFRLLKSDDESLHRVIYFSPYKNDLLLLSEIDYQGYGAGFIVRFDGKTLKTKWQCEIPGFNIAQGLIENKWAYLAAIGFIAKIDLETGKYLWKHDNLYRKYNESGAFNIFETPKSINNLVLFKEEGENNQIEVNKMSGKIIKVSLN
jgi:hypothetical protein